MKDKLFNNRVNKQKNISKLIILGFLVTILVGSVILYLPVSNTREISYVDALFTATSATCVTGHSTVDVLEQFSLFGQFVIMILIEVGGLGFILLATVAFIAFGKRITLQDRVMLGQSLSQNKLGGLVKFAKNIFKYSIIFQSLGALILAIKFIPEYGIGDGAFKSIFHAVSIFCNSGFDLVEGESLSLFRSSVLVNLVVIGLTIIGGLGFIVWQDINIKFQKSKIEKISFKKYIHSLNMHTKLALITTIILIIVGAVGIFLIEQNNPATIADFNLKDKVLASTFQSVSSRSTGMSTIHIGSLLPASKILMIFLMFIGGAPGGTAGGIKTVTLAVLLILIYNSIKGKQNISACGREIPKKIIYKAISVVIIAMFIVGVSTVLLTISEPNVNSLDLLFEVVSSIGTTGLSTGITSSLSLAGKSIIMLLMYIGRVGTVTMMLAFVVDKPKNEENIRYPEEDIIVG